MTAFAPFPSIPSRHPVRDAPPVRCGETRPAVVVLRAGPDRAAAHLRAVFGAGAGDAVLAAQARLAAALDDRGADVGALALLVAATLQGPDAEESARPMEVHFVPAHRMQALVLAARDFGLALRRAPLRRHGVPPPPCGPARKSRRQ